MLFTDEVGSTGPLVVLLHWLGGSSRSWAAVSQGLAHRGFRCVAIDLPGFGRESLNPGTSVSEMVSQIVATIRTLRRTSHDEPWLLAGHSMGGELAKIIARMASDGSEGLENLAGIVLVSSSPPSPEPMSEKKRTELEESLGFSDTDENKRRQSAEKFIDDNTGRLPLLPDVKSERSPMFFV
jgi:pimeloyl-ACP methyl ester carboxylesterase